MELMEAFSLSASKLALLFEYLEKRGITRHEFLERIGLDPNVLEHPDNRVPLDVLETIFALAYELTGDCHFGMHFGEEIEKGPSNILNYMMMNCDTIEEVLKKYCFFEVVQDDISKTEYRCEQGVCYVMAAVRYGSAFFKEQYIESKFTSMVHYAKRLTGFDLSLKEVRFAHEPLGNISEYERIFKCSVVFDCEQNLILLPCSDLSIRIKEPNRKLLGIFERHAAEMLVDLFHRKSYSARVVKIIMQNIPGIIPRIEDVACELEMSVRSLQQKLKEEGTSYRSLLDSVRRDLAKNFLSDRTMAITDIAYTLGFSEPCVFHRKFKKWTKTTPSVFRNTIKPTVKGRSSR
ncbi:MAG: AraC family transcriptional regulator [Desulfomonilia bacterium]|nr:AraC family transcriptional regulator [Desulfomonilia bacterium]